MYILMAAGAALCFTIGGIFMQKSQGLTQLLPTSLLFLCFLLGASLQTLAMQKTGEMGKTYVLVVGLEAILAVGFGTFIFHEGYSFLKLLGIVLITVGVVFLRSTTS
jgi:small multidrug resistance pump